MYGKYLKLLRFFTGVPVSTVYICSADASALTSEPSVKLGISICHLSTQFHINTVLDSAKNCLFDLIFVDRNILMSLSGLSEVLHVLDQCIFYQKFSSGYSGVIMATKIVSVPSTKSADLFVLITMK